MIKYVMQVSQRTTLVNRPTAVSRQLILILLKPRRPGSKLGIQLYYFLGLKLLQTLLFQRSYDVECIQK